MDIKLHVWIRRFLASTIKFQALYIFIHLTTSSITLSTEQLVQIKSFIAFYVLIHAYKYLLRNQGRHSIKIRRKSYKTKSYIRKQSFYTIYKRLGCYRIFNYAKSFICPSGNTWVPVSIYLGKGFDCFLG